MADQLLPLRLRYHEPDGVTPLSGGRVLFTRTGTMQPADLFTDPEGKTSGPNPVVLGSDGTMPQVWFADQYAVDAIFYAADGSYRGTSTNVPRWGATDAAASGISLNAVEGLADATNVQAAIEALAGYQAEQSEKTVEELRTDLGLGSAATRSLSADPDFTVAGSSVPTRDGVRDYHEANTAFTRKVSLGNYSITSGGALQVSHGFGALPSAVEAWLTCTTADAGYQPGDSIMVPWCSSDTTTARMNTLQRRTGDIVVRFTNATSCFAAAHRTTAVPTPLSNGAWTLSVIILR